MELLDGVSGPEPPPRASGEGSSEGSEPQRVDLLGTEPDAPPPSTDGRRPRWRTVLALALAVGLGVATGAYATTAHENARARSAAIAAARSTVNLSALQISTNLDEAGHLQVLAMLRNRGPEPLVIRGARLGRVLLDSPGETVAPGELWFGRGVTPGNCPVQADVQGALVVNLSTADGVQRTLELQPARDFLLQVVDLPSPDTCQAVPGFESAYVGVDVYATKIRNRSTTRLDLRLTIQLPSRADRAALVAIGVVEPGIVTKAVRGLPTTVRTDQTIAVSIDVSAPSCSAVRLPDDPAVGPYLWFRGRVLPHGTFANAQGYEANTVLVAVLRMLARACPGVLTR